MKITDAFLGEHGVFYTQFDELEASLAQADLAGLKQQAIILASALETHAHLEDELIFAADSDIAVFDMMREEHETIAAGLMQLQQVRELDRARILLREVIETARDHFEKEERVAFPMIEQTLTVAEQQQLGARWAQARGVRCE